MKNKLLIASIMAMSATMPIMAKTDDLRFDPTKFTTQQLTMPDGEQVTYKAYEGIFYVKNVEDPTYQKLQ